MAFLKSLGRKTSGIPTVRGLNSKTLQFYNNILVCDDIDVALLTETWSNTTLLDSVKILLFSGLIEDLIRPKFLYDHIVIGDDVDLISNNVDLLAVYTPPATPIYIFEQMFHKPELLSLLGKLSYPCGRF
ncbi:hypothetical protein Trydic_g2323 [Trypoxylus dichotomus]